MKSFILKNSFIRLYFVIEAFLAFISLIIFVYSDDSARSVIAHFTGLLTVINLLLAYYLLHITKIKNKWIKIVGKLGCFMMIAGYILYLFENISPYSHAWASLNFDGATMLMANFMQLICFTLLLGRGNG